MEGFRSALAQYLIGDLEVTDLENAIDVVLADTPAAEAQLQELLDDLFQSGRLPHQIYALLKRHIEQSREGAQTGGERTQFQPPSSATDIPEEERTAVPPIGVGGSPADSGSNEPPDDATRIMVPGASGGAPTAATGASTTATGSATGSILPGTTGVPTGQSGWSNQSRPTTAPGSNWSHPSQWAGRGNGPAQPVETGSVIKDRFLLEEMIGQGGMGRVFKAIDVRKQEAQDRNPHVAVKVLNEDFKQHPHALQALQRESRKAQDLAHPNIVTVFDFDREGETVYMTMEFLEGESLDKFIKRHLLRGVPFERAISIIESLADGLAYAHAKGVVHSDFKPANAFLTSAGVVKVFDFGIARAASAQSSGEAEGEGEKTLFDAGELGALTPAYASCEMIEGGDPDPRDDVYALALVAYELLAGKHPFDKKSAVVARDSNVTLDPVKGLSRRQWRAIQHGLAFKREERSASVQEFMSELRPKSQSIPLVAAAAVIVVGIVLGLVFAVPQYLDQREVDSLVADISSGRDELIGTRIENLHSLRDRDASLFRDVFAEDQTRKDFIGYYRRQIRVLWNPSAQRLNYPAAAALVTELDSFFSDSQDVGALEQEIQAERGDAILQLFGRLEPLLAQGIMIPAQGEENATLVLDTIRQINPGHERLSQQDIPIRFAEVASELRQDGQLPLAEQVLNQGLALTPENIALINVKDAIDSQRNRVAREARITELEVTLAGASQNASQRTSSTTRLALEELINLDPANATVVSLRGAIQTDLAVDLERITGAGEYAEGYRLLQSFQGLAADQFLAERRAALDAAASEYLIRIDALFADLQQAVEGDRLDEGAGNAKSTLAELESMAADVNRLADARTQIAAGYSRRAGRAQQGGNWDQARDNLRLGLAMNPLPSQQNRLEAELSQIDANQRQAEAMAAEDRQRMIAEQRQQEVVRLQTEFDAVLNRATFAAADAREALVAMQALTDYEVQIANGRARVADRLVQTAESYLNQARFDDALTLAQQGSQILPDQPALGSLIGRVESERAGQAAELERQRLNTVESEISELLASAQLDQSWDQAINRALADYAAIVGEDSRQLAARRTRVAELYVEDAARQLQNSRLVNARDRLERAERYAPDLAALATARAQLEDQQEALTVELAAQAQGAELNNRKFALTAEVEAGNLDAAIRIFERLKSEIPGDEFVTRAAPRAIASGYANLGLQAMGNSDGYKDAAKLLTLAGNWSENVPEVAALRRAIDEAAEERFAKISNVMLGDQPLNVKAIAALMDDLQTAAPRKYEELSGPLVSSVADRINELSRSQRTVAKRKLQEAQAIFPDAASLAELQIGAAAPASGDPCANPGLVGNGDRPRGSCRDKLPGDNRGPALVVIPAGGPFSKPVAFSKFEISVHDYNIYCEQSGACSPKGGDPKLPLTQISAQEAEQFVGWLGEVSGAKYRIPSGAEWEYAASANGDQPKANWNCQVSSNGVLMKGIDLMTVDTGDGNGWGLYNYVGNARELVTNGSAWQVRGGAYRRPIVQCEISLSDSHSGDADRFTGFRVVRELG